MNSASFDEKKMTADEIFDAIEKLGLPKLKLMEVCGTHTMAIAKSGIKRRLPENIELLSGPGCPVCVTPATVIDAILGLSEKDNIIIATYGDMIRVPGSRQGDNLAYRRALGARVEVVYSPLDAIKIASENKNSEVVFLGAGFETTAPGTAAAIGAAHDSGVSNFSVLAMLKTVEPALRALISAPDFAVNGFICPGHVATIIGECGFRFLPEEYGLPGVIGGFEPLELIYAIYKLLRMIKDGAPAIENEYKRAVRRDGNPLAMKMIRKYLVPVSAVWRGLGRIDSSGLGIRDEFEKYDAEKKFGIIYGEEDKKSICRCGEVITGRLSPKQCPLFGKACCPENPIGPCMVSSEGACAAAYKYSD